MLLAMLALLPASSSGELIAFIVMIMPACMLCIHTHSPTIKTRRWQFSRGTCSRTKNFEFLPRNEIESNHTCSVPNYC